MTAIAVPLVSVIVPTYNRVGVVLRAVRSILNQTEADFEVLVVDDGSTDDTPNVLASIEDRRVRVLRTDHVGLSGARNLAIDAARGTWIAFLDDDNEWLPTYLERQLAAAAAMPDAVAVYCPAQSYHEDTGRLGRQTPWYTTAGDLFAPMMRRGYPRVSATLVQRTTITELGGFPPDLLVAADCELLLRVGLRGPFARNPEALALRYRHADQMSTKVDLQRDSYRIQATRLRDLVVQRGGYRAWTTWLRWHLGEAETAVLVRTPLPERRAAARVAVRHLAPYLPWSAPAMVRPALNVTLGPYAVETLRDWYRSAHRTLRGRPDAPTRGNG